MKLIEGLKARYQRTLRDARTAAVQRAIGPTETWRRQAIEALSGRVRMSGQTTSGVLLHLAKHWGEDLKQDELRPLLRELAALVPWSERAGLPPSIRSAIRHFDYATDTPVTPGPVARVLISARLIYRAWRQDV